MSRSPKRLQRQRGISSITAIFLVTVLAVLASVGVQMYRSAQDDQTLDLQLMRARSAARGAMQLGYWRVVKSGSGCVAAITNINNMPATLASYTVTLNCAADSFTDGASTAVTRYRLQAVACNRPAAGATSCPNDAASTTSGYVETTASAECTVAVTGGVTTAECR